MGLRRRFALYLSPAILQAGLSLVTLPLATLVLGPRDYGAYALVSGVTGVGTSLATSASGMLLPTYFARLGVGARAALISTLLLAAEAVALVFVGLLWLGWPLLSGRVDGTELVGGAALLCASSGLLLSVPWSIAYLVVILEGRVGTYARATILAALVSAIGLLASLFWAGLGIEALFIAYLGSTLVLGAYGLAVLCPYLAPASKWISPDSSGGWGRRIARLTFVAGTANSLELLQTLAERLLLARFGGAQNVGLYTHAQMYRNFLFTPLKAASNSIWPRSLEEARDRQSSFADTRRVWDTVFLALTVAGLGTAFLGDDVAALLTHGKFREAGYLIPAFVVVLLVQFSGKPQVATLYANDEGEYLGRLMGLCATVAIVALLALVPLAGLWGAALALALQQGLYRVGVHMRARLHRPTPFQDRIAFKGIALILLAIAIELYAAPDVLADVLLSAAFVLVVLVNERATVAQLGMVVARWRERPAA